MSDNFLDLANPHKYWIIYPVTSSSGRFFIPNSTDVNSFQLIQMLLKYNVYSYVLMYDLEAFFGQFLVIQEFFGQSILDNP